MDYGALKKGMQIKWRGKTATLLSDARYEITPRSGLYYADVLWDDDVEERGFMLCRIGLEKVEETWQDLVYPIMAWKGNHLPRLPRALDKWRKRARCIHLFKDVDTREKP